MKTFYTTTFIIVTLLVCGVIAFSEPREQSNNSLVHDNDTRKAAESPSKLNGHSIIIPKADLNSKSQILEVYNMLGTKIRTLKSSTDVWRWDLKNQAGYQVQAGYYFVRSVGIDGGNILKVSVPSL